MHRSAQEDSLQEVTRFINKLNREERWGPDVEQISREATKKVLEDLMACSIDRRLQELAERGQADRRNGYYPRHILTGIGDIEVLVPRTRTFSAKAVLEAYARRTKDVDRAILACFVLGLSTRKVGKALQPMLGERVSATTVSRIAKTLDQAVEAFHQRKIITRYRALVLDGVVLSRKTGAGAIKRPVLVALGILPDGRKEVLDFRLSQSESAAEWRVFLTSLYKRGLIEKGLEVIVVDGGAGLLSALPEVYPDVRIQRCWAHKVRNVTDKVRKADREKVKRSVQKIYNAPNLVKARSAARRFADRWEEMYPRAVNCLRRDLDDLLTCFRVSEDEDWRIQIRTTNAIERRFREVRRRTRPMGVFSDRTSMERILFAVFTNENQSQNISTLFLVTQ